MSIPGPEPSQIIETKACLDAKKIRFEVIPTIFERAGAVLVRRPKFGKFTSGGGSNSCKNRNLLKFEIEQNS